MTTPQGPSPHDPSKRTRPGQSPPRRPERPSESPTTRMRPGQWPEDRPQQPPPGPQQPPPGPPRPVRPPGAPPQRGPRDTGYPPGQRSGSPRPRQRPGAPPVPSGQPPTPPEPATTRLSTRSPAPGSPAKGAKDKRRFAGNRLSLVLVLVIVVLSVVAGLIGAELYVRNLANSKVAHAVQCEVQDSANVSFAFPPPVLWQYLTRHYPDISIQTAGNQIRDAKRMAISIDIRDVALRNAKNSKGTIGALTGTITWSAEGIKQSIQDAIPVLGSFVTSQVTTNPGEGTVELQGLLDKATVKPQIVNNGLSLQVISLTALGSKLSTDTVQKNLDDLTSKATQNYPLGIHADGVKVTSTGVEATFSTSNATIPSGGGGGQNPCFAGL
ncbi:LmeA family phospholipid-binding protein [Mycobacterium sp. SM1]|uniref:LmeA family phospholipid-binding protein n=1 Tax=Mycobacterium sp. SM1 TaxID=2816243 RepID=UPI001BCD051A|nr:DUF2993 domain-containing protein [Mycobacterium sp. SM1]MBS4728521.1 LmeA family phospholipid-binding protein [Mycobacterium sp. SM1]